MLKFPCGNFTTVGGSLERIVSRCGHWELVALACQFLVLLDEFVDLASVVVLAVRLRTHVVEAVPLPAQFIQFGFDACDAGFCFGSSGWLISVGLVGCSYL